MPSAARWYEHVTPPSRRRRVLAVAAIVSIALHLGLFAGLSGNAARPRPAQAPSIDVEIVKVEPPPPPPPPEPEPVVKDPEVAPKPRIVEREPTKQPPPPPNQEPPPEPQEAPPPIRIGISLGSTTEGGAVALGTGNTLYGKADRVAGDPADARPYAAEEYEKAPFVPSSRVTSLPRVVREAPKIYPDDARRSGIEGQVICRIRIDHTGKVTQVKVVEGPGHGLDEAARAALYQFVWKPAEVDGKAVATEISYVYTFLID